MLDLKQMISGLKKPVVPDRISNFLTDTAGHDPNASLSVGSGRPLMETGSIQDSEPADDFNLPKLLAQSVATAFKPPEMQPMMAPQSIQSLNQRAPVPPLRTNYQLPRFDQGGFLPVGRKGIVGGRNRRTGNTEEQIEVTPGGVQITPIDPLHPDQSAIQKYGMPGALPTFTPPAPAPIASPGGVPLPAPIAGQPMDNAALVAPTNAIEGTVREPTRDEQIAKYEQDLIAAPEKPNKFLSGLFLALQGVDKIFSPNNKPIVSLAEARKEERNRGLLPKLEVLKGQKKAEREAEEARIKAELTGAQIEDIKGRPAQKEADRKAKADLAVKRINLSADIRSGQAKPFIDEEGKVWRQYLNADSTGKVRPNEPVIGPDGQQEYVPGEQGIEWKNPRTGKTEVIKARQGASADAVIAGQDARLIQDADKFNASQQVEVLKTNVANQYNYSKTLFDRLTEISKTNAEVQGANQATQGLYAQLEQAAAKLNTLDPTADEKGYESAHKDFLDKQEKFYQAAAKTQAGSALVQQMAAQGIARPDSVTFKPIKAAKVGNTGRPVPPSKDPLGIFR